MSKTYRDKRRYLRKTVQKERRYKYIRELEESLEDPETLKQFLKSGARKRAKLNKVKGRR